MKNALLTNTDDILNRHIGGFHIYGLSPSVRLIFVSLNFCNMTGFGEKELLSEDEDLYAEIVHPADRETYFEFINNLKSKEQTLTCEYRLIKKDGTVICVRDSASSKKTENGILCGYSVLTDITEIKKENDNLQFLNETIPCGFIKYTCEKQPKITYMNRQMEELLRFPKNTDGKPDYTEIYKDNLFLMVPMEERRRFALYLNRVYSAGVPTAGEMTLLRCDGTKVYIFGWVAKCTDEHGNEEFQSVCIDMTKRFKAKKENEKRRYLKALADVYDKIFEYNTADNTVNCLYSNNSPMFKWLENIPMQMEEATEKWISETVIPEDCDKVRSFFKDFRSTKKYGSNGKPPQITYRAKSSDGEIKLYSGIFLKTDDSVSLYCCRCIQDIAEADFLKNENISLKENMQEIIARFTDGIAAFEVTDKQLVTPLYASDNVCGFFGLTKEEWLPLMKKATPLKDFVARCKTPYKEFDGLLRKGEAEFVYFDLKSGTEQRIKAICSQQLPVPSAPRYVMLYNVNKAEVSEDPSPEKREVNIRTFGYFDVFVGDKPIAFRNKKAKELFALLVDRRGGYISSDEAIGFLWEDEPVSSVTLARYRKVALRLKNTLEEYGIPDIIESVDGKRRIATEKVQCDLYNYLSGKKKYSQLFKGSYLTNYSWGETTLAELTGKILY